MNLSVQYEKYLNKWQKRLDNQYEKDLKIYGHQEAMCRFQFGMSRLQAFSYAEYREIVLGEI